MCHGENKFLSFDDIVVIVKSKFEVVVSISTNINTYHLKSSSECQFSNFSAISWREQVNFQWDDDEVRFVLDKHAELDFYSASLLKQQSAGRHVAPRRHYPDSEPTSLCSFSLMLRISNKYQFYSLWLDPTGVRTHDLPHSRRAR